MSKQDGSRTQPERHSGLRRRIQSVAFWTLYHFGGTIYDRFTRLLFGDAWNRWRLTSLKLVESGPVLDLGCGTGVLLSALAKRGFEAIGVDRERSMLRGASRRPELAGQLLRANATRLPLQSGSIGSCVSTFPSGFILQPETLNEIARVLRRGGVFLVVMSGETTERVWWRSPIRLMLRLFYGKRTTHSLPEESLLSHPQLRGEWRWIEYDYDRVLVWIAHRTDNRARCED
ncbi:MAG: methyltransferase domain-containing protein [Nitrolancea sp.]